MPWNPVYTEKSVGHRLTSLKEVKRWPTDLAVPLEARTKVLQNNNRFIERQTCIM